MEHSQTNLLVSFLENAFVNYGNFSRLAETNYLHIKVINVQSGEIIGSSISEGSTEKDFLGMCNGAVEPLF